MLPGNGRHRRPRQVPAIVVTAGVTGSALALPLLAATGANAADTATWDKVADCESGGTWSANFGSGAYGGLQFTLEQWKNAGGLEYAERPDLASRSQQIAVAERVLESQGPEAWPLCSASAGLSKNGPKPDVDTGTSKIPGPVGPTPVRPDFSVPSTGRDKPSTDFGAPTPAPGTPGPGVLPDYPLGATSGLPVMPEPDYSLPPTPTTGPTVPPTTPANPGNPGNQNGQGNQGNSNNQGNPANPTAPGTPTAPVDPTAPATPGATPSPSASAGASDGSGKHRGPAAVEVPAAPGAASASAAEPVYTVKPGDSLAAIADANGLKGGWTALYQANEQVIGKDADLIKPGQNLDLTKK
ncbi:LysM domain-containing protein [Streptomyces sp. 3211.6]|uniref:LysM peptidoglycan-binding domain-containing protein n=1 Tax=Streptomyces sp. 3211.6 TaxID=1938845 RepID=UPI000EB0D010|nr:transglycosylase family protein [Streptomyces sp. 3211.6]RKT05080.1 LysM domain-containing protein [Streptomyces sp. 3211.6]